jgi:hypothetical protein
MSAVFDAVARIAGRRRAVRKSDEHVGRAVQVGVGSAHLLRDLGFEAAGGPGGCVWRSGAYRTGVCRRDAGVRLLRDARF